MCKPCADTLGDERASDELVPDASGTHCIRCAMFMQVRGRPMLSTTRYGRWE